MSAKTNIEKIQLTTKTLNKLKFNEPPIPGTFVDYYTPLGMPGEYVLADDTGIVLALFN